MGSGSLWPATPPPTPTIKNASSSLTEEFFLPLEPFCGARPAVGSRCTWSMLVADVSNCTGLLHLVFCRRLHSLFTHLPSSPSGVGFLEWLENHLGYQWVLPLVFFPSTSCCGITHSDLPAQEQSRPLPIPDEHPRRPCLWGTLLQVCPLAALWSSSVDFGVDFVAVFNMPWFNRFSMFKG